MQKQKGFTFIELLIVAAIVAIITAIAVPVLLLPPASDEMVEAVALKAAGGGSILSKFGKCSESGVTVLVCPAEAGAPLKYVRVDCRSSRNVSAQHDWEFTGSHFEATNRVVCLPPGPEAH